MILSNKSRIGAYLAGFAYGKRLDRRNLTVNEGKQTAALISKSYEDRESYMDGFSCGVTAAMMGN